MKSIYNKNILAKKSAWQLESIDTTKSPLAQPTSFNWYYQQKLLKRHRNYLTNQWWNGQLTEHSAESLFLSDIDWRLTFNTLAESQKSQAKRAWPTMSDTFSSAEEGRRLSPSGFASFTIFLDKLKDTQKIKYNIAVLNSAYGRKSASPMDRARPEGLLSFADISENLSPEGRKPLDASFNFAKADFLETNLGIYQQDILIDFPDADQLYNPKHRRWMLTSGYMSSWFTFDKKIQTEIVEHLIFECFIQSYNLLDQNRELLDYSVNKFLKTGLIKEIHFISFVKKFS